MYTALQKCIEYLGILRIAYGPELVLDPYVLAVNVFDASDDTGQLLLRPFLHLHKSF